MHTKKKQHFFISLIKIEINEICISDMIEYWENVHILEIEFDREEKSSMNLFT